MHFAFGRHPRGFCCAGSTPSFSPIVLSNFIVFSSENRKFPGAKKPTVAFFVRGAVSNHRFETAPFLINALQSKKDHLENSFKAVLARFKPYYFFFF